MTLKEFVETNWYRGNVVKFKNGKEYLVKGTKGHGRWLLLYSEEYDKCFTQLEGMLGKAAHNIKKALDDSAEKRKEEKYDSNWM